MISAEVLETLTEQELQALENAIEELKLQEQMQLE